jgi:hypothetical protein
MLHPQIHRQQFRLLFRRILHPPPQPICRLAFLPLVLLLVPPHPQRRYRPRRRPLVRRDFRARLPRINPQMVRQILHQLHQPIFQRIFQLLVLLLVPLYPPRPHRRRFQLNDPAALRLSFQAIPPRPHRRRFQLKDPAAFRRSYQAILPQSHRRRFQLSDPAAIRRSYQVMLPRPHRRHFQLNDPAAFRQSVPRQIRRSSHRTFLLTVLVSGQLISLLCPGPVDLLERQQAPRRRTRAQRSSQML